MRTLIVLTVLAALTGLGPGCRLASDDEVVVTREQFGDAWPLQVNSAKVVCTENDEDALLKLGSKLYALGAGSRARGYPDASAVARQTPVDPDNPAHGSAVADLSPLRAACDTTPENVATR